MSRPRHPFLNSINHVHRYCPRDVEVQQFLETEFLDFTAYRQKLTARELFRAARDKFGDLCCDSVLYYEH